MQDDAQNDLPGVSFNKESEPFSPSESVRRTEEEPVLTSQEQEAGVRVIPHEHPIPQEAGEAGLDYAKEARQPSLTPTLKVPMTKQQAKQASKGSVFDSITWLATLISMLFKKQERED